MELYSVHVMLYPSDRHLPHSTASHIYLPFPVTSDDNMLTLMWPRCSAVIVEKIRKVEESQVTYDMFTEVLENITWCVETLQYKQQEGALLEKCRKAGREMIEWEERRQRRDKNI